VFDYVMVLAAVIIGLAVTHLMQGVASLLEERGKDRIWWVHLVWVAYMLLRSMFWWWFEYMLRGVQVWTFAKYLFVLTYAFLTYMAAAVLFPRHIDDYASYEDYFLNRRVWFFGLLAISTAIDPIDSSLKGAGHLASLGVEYWVAISSFCLAFVVAAVTRRKNVHAAIAVAALLYQVSWAVRMFYTVH
jgi:hypothetical protein